MERLRVIYVEDELLDYDRFSFTITQAWNDLNRGIPIEFRREENPMDFLHSLDWDEDVCDILLVDVLYGEKEITEGCEVIHHAVQRLNCGVIGISTSHDALNKARGEGAHAVLSKELIENDRKLGRQEIQEVFERVLEQQGRTPYRIDRTSIDLERQDESLKSLVETVGEENLKVIAVKLIGQQVSRVELGEVSAGYSGAQVIRMRCELGQSNHKRPYLVKLSRDEGALVAEFENRTLADRFAGDAVITPIDRPPKALRSGGWYALASPFYNAMTLFDCLTARDGVTRHVETILETILVNRLSDTYRVCDVQEVSVPSLYHEILRVKSRRGRVEQAVLELAPLAERFGPGGARYRGERPHDRAKWEQTLVERFLRENYLGPKEFSRFPRTSLVCMCHGDLHLRNVLVDRKVDDAKVVDLANAGSAPRGSDVARLAVDTIVAGLDYGPESYDWDHMADWLDVVEPFVLGEIIALPDSPGCSITKSLNWFNANYHTIFARPQAMSQGEWQLALAVQFLLVSYRREGLSAPKRVLGLLAACLSLREAANNIESP